MLGLKRYKVHIADPDPNWRAEYEKIASEILGAADGLELRVEHIGSTSVPGLAAKPIIDVGILLNNEDQFGDLVKALASIDLIYRGDKGAVGGRLFIRESGREFRTHHIHAYFNGAPEWDQYLVFRERLRGSAALCEEYSKLKRKLSVQFREDRFSYTEAKSEFVNRILTDP